MRERLVGMLLASVLLWPCLARADDAPGAALAQQMQLNRERYGIVGQAVLVARGGAVVFRGVDGVADLRSRAPVSTEHVFPAYSLSKLFVSTLLMQLVEQERIDLDAPAAAYLPGLPAHWRSIAVRDFLDHTSGVPEYFRQDGAGAPPVAFPADLPALFASLADAPLLFVPGSSVRYTQTNYVVLAALLAAHYGKPYPQVVEERLLRRLELQHTWLGPDRLPRERVVTSYVGKAGRLQQDRAVVWPAYAYGHADLYLTLDDLARFLRAMSAGELVRQETLQALWRPRTLRGGQRGWFAAGWEYGESGEFRHVGHDGGARDRVRLLFDDSLDGEVYVIAYLTNGSARNVWSRVLVESALAAVAPDRFPREALAEALLRHALRAPVDGDAEAEAGSIRASTVLADAELERVVNASGYAIRDNLGLGPALRVFRVNTVLFPDSANAWDSLAEAYAAAGDAPRAEALYAKSRRLGRITAPGRTVSE